MIAQKISNRTIAIAGPAFRGDHRLVHTQLPAGKSAERFQNAAECVLPFGIVDQAGTGYRAGIGHRIEGTIVGTQTDRIEDISARLDANEAFDPLRTERFERKREYEGLGGGLNCEGNTAVAYLVNVTVGRRDADAKIIRIGLGELGNVVGDSSAGIACDLCMAALQKSQQWRLDNLTPACTRTNGQTCARIHAHPLPDAFKEASPVPIGEARLTQSARRALAEGLDWPAP